MGDAELVALAQRGELTALATVFERHRPSLYAAAIGLLRDRDEAADAVQDTFVTALTKISSLQDPAAIRSWLRTVLQNACLMRLRQRRPVLMAEVPDRVDGAVDLERFVEQRAARDVVWSGVDSLSEEERVTLVLRHFSRCASYQAIAEVTGVPVGTVRSRLHRAHQRLADELVTRECVPPHDQGHLECQRRAQWEVFYEGVLQAPEPRTYRPLFHDDVQVHEW
jgi:RNA polymerase sigma-70 factor (ECF subfamily)